MAVAGPVAAQRRDSVAVPAASLQREVFAYEGGGRHPFMSLLKSGDVRPLISGLQLTTNVYDGRFAARSVALPRDVTDRRNYRVNAGDIAGRLQRTQIPRREAV